MYINIPKPLQLLLQKYGKWVVLDMPRMSYKEYQNIRLAVVSKLADLANDGHVFVLPAVNQSVHFMDALMQLGAKFVVVLTRKVGNEQVAIRSKLGTVGGYDKAFVIEHGSCRNQIVERAQQILSNPKASPRAVAWAKSTLSNPLRADFIDGLRSREAVMRYVLENAKDPKFIAVFRGEPEYLAADMKNLVPTWQINLRAIRQAA